MSNNRVSSSTFLGRFVARDQALRYRDRYRTGRHARVDKLERAALRGLMADLDPLHRVLDLPSGTGRLSAVLAEFADRVTLADGSNTMLQIAREDLNGLPADYIQTGVEDIALKSASIDLVFCHRLLNHVKDVALRARMFHELTRVAGRYVLLSCYAPSFRNRLRRWGERCFVRRHRSEKRSIDLAEILELANSNGLSLVRRWTIRRIPAGEFLLFEHHSRPAYV